MSINKTIVDASNEPLPVSSAEYIIFSHTPTTLTLTSGSGFPADTLHIHQPQGTLHITTHRLVFVAPQNKTFGEFSTFSAHLDDICVKLEKKRVVMSIELVESGRPASVVIEFPGEYDAEAAFGVIEGANRKTNKQ